MVCGLLNLRLMNLSDLRKSGHWLTFPASFPCFVFEHEHPASVPAFHPKGTPLLEPNPIAFVRNALRVSIAVNILLLARCHAN